MLPGSIPPHSDPDPDTEANNLYADAGPRVSAS
jgi:hypothetical protein